MKSSTLHRSGLTRERMAMLENTCVASFDKVEKIHEFEKRNESPHVPQSVKHAKVRKVHDQLDILYKGVERTFSKATTSTQLNKTPGAYLGIGFVAGLLVMFSISLIVALVSGSHAPKDTSGAPVTVVAADKFQETTRATEEKYVVKAGDTLDKIAYRFYGKYDNEKIQQIQALNNITNPSALQVGQVLIIPVNK